MENSKVDLRPKTIFCDIDGTLVRHNPPTETTNSNAELELLPGVLEKLLEWDKLGYNIILVSGRRESSRLATEKQLAKLGIIYDQLILGIGGGKRYIINDSSLNHLLRAAPFLVFRTAIFRPYLQNNCEQINKHSNRHNQNARDKDYLLHCFFKFSCLL